jgi:hypothetical protein
VKKLGILRVTKQGLGKIRHCYHGRLESLSSILDLFGKNTIRITIRIICYYLLEFID